jgi:hypothetical protein
MGRGGTRNGPTERTRDPIVSRWWVKRERLAHDQPDLVAARGYEPRSIPWGRVEDMPLGSAAAGPRRRRPFVLVGPDDRVARSLDRRHSSAPHASQGVGVARGHHSQPRSSRRSPAVASFLGQHAYTRTDLLDRRKDLVPVAAFHRVAADLLGQEVLSLSRNLHESAGRYRADISGASTSPIS